jgi:hypothetical protein
MEAIYPKFGIELSIYEQMGNTFNIIRSTSR